jgi:iron complex outermembrane receptor protein
MKKKILLTPIALVTSMLVSGVYAQDKVLSPVVVTGQNNPSITQVSIDEAKTKVKEIPGGASIVDMENVREGRTSTWVDMLGMAPGVFVQERFGSEEARVSIRGSGLSRTYHGFGLKVMQDGIPINYADGNFDMQTVDASAARYVEVLRGANASSYGGTTLGGAINLISSTGYDKRNLARAEVGSFEYRRAQLQLGNVYQQADGKVFDYNVSMSGNSQEGFRDWAQQESQKIVSNFGVKINQNV